MNEFFNFRRTTYTYDKIAVIWSENSLLNCNFELQRRQKCSQNVVCVWRFGSVGNVVGRINEVNQRRARLVLGWVTVCRRVNHLGM